MSGPRLGQVHARCPACGGLAVTSGTRSPSIKHAPDCSTLVDPAARILRIVDRLAASWHAASLDDDDDFSKGRAAGYCFAISLMLDVPFSNVNAALRDGRL